MTENGFAENHYHLLAGKLSSCGKPKTMLFTVVDGHGDF